MAAASLAAVEAQGVGYAYGRKRVLDNITFRLEANNVLKSEFCRDRLRFNGLVGLGSLREIEDSCSAGGGQKIALKIRTTF